MRLRDCSRAHFRLALASAPRLNRLTSPHRVTRRPVLQKVRNQAFPLRGIALSLLVSIWFQVLFHSPPGVLFTFPSRYYTLSVIKSYLALGDGPPIFRQGFSCPAVLWIPLGFKSISFTGLSPSLALLSSELRLPILLPCHGPNPCPISETGLGCYPFARHY